jgi:hypothetical protein
VIILGLEILEAITNNASGTFHSVQILILLLLDGITNEVSMWLIL